MNNKLCSLHQLFFILEKSPTVIIFQKDKKEYSARQFFADVIALQHQIPKSNQHWALCFQDHYLFAVALFAVLYKNCVPVLLPNHQPSCLENLALHYDAILTDIATIKNNTEKKYICIDDIKHIDVENLKEFAKNLNSEQLIIFFTSGSTGEPKKISRTLTQLTAELNELETLFGSRMRGSIFSTVSHQHLYGLLFYILWPLCSGRVINLMSLDYPEQIINLASPFVLIASPALLKRMDDCCVNLNDSVIFSSGGLLKQEVAKSVYDKLGVYPIEIFGSTETSAIGWRSQENSYRWKPFPSVKLQLHPETNCLMVMQSSFFDVNDAYLMSDKANFNEDGSFEFLGRSDRVVKIEEKRISLHEIENILEKDKCVQQAYALKLEDSRQYIAVIIALTQNGREQLKKYGKLNLNKYFKTLLSSYFDALLLPKRFRYVEEIPVNTQGKYIPALLEKLFERDIKYPKILSSRLSDDLTECVLEIHIPTALIYFIGHFADMPILPGVVQIDWAIHFSAQFMGVDKKNIGNIPQVKFTKIILPDTTLFLSLKREENKIKFRYFDDASAYSSGTFRI